MSAPQSSVATSLRLMKALGLARQGNLDSAQQVLAPADTPPESALEVHALAALVTHQGDYERALRLWRLLLQKDPDHAEAKRMIEMIELWIGRPAWFRYIPGTAVALATLGLGALLFWALHTPEPPIKRAPAVLPARVAPAAPSAAPAPFIQITPVKAAPAKNSRG